MPSSPLLQFQPSQATVLPVVPYSEGTPLEHPETEGRKERAERNREGASTTGARTWCLSHPGLSRSVSVGASFFHSSHHHSLQHPHFSSAPPLLPPPVPASSPRGSDGQPVTHMPCGLAGSMVNPPELISSPPSRSLTGLAPATAISLLSQRLG